MFATIADRVVRWWARVVGGRRVAREINGYISGYRAGTEDTVAEMRRFLDTKWPAPPNSG